MAGPPPQLLVVGGPNGAGKSTIAEAFEQRRGWRYIGADRIAAEHWPDDPLGHAIEAGKRFSTEVSEAIAARENFIVETTLSGRSFLKVIESAADAGYHVAIAFVFVDSASTSIARVAVRVRKGGHNVPEVDIRRRFKRSLRNFWQLYPPACDRWRLFDNDAPPLVVASGTSQTLSIEREPEFQRFLELIYGHE